MPALLHFSVKPASDVIHLVVEPASSTAVKPASPTWLSNLPQPLGGQACLAPSAQAMQFPISTQDRPCCRIDAPPAPRRPCLVSMNFKRREGRHCMRPKSGAGGPSGPRDDESASLQTSAAAAVGAALAGASHATAAGAAGPPAQCCAAAAAAAAIAPPLVGR